MSTIAPTGPQTFAGVRVPEPRVELILAGETVLLATRYQVRLSILTQPAQFSLTLGTGASLRELMRDAEPNTPFELKIDDRLVMTGRIDGWETSGASGILQIEGRDALAPLHDGCLEQEQTFKDDTYAALVRKVMDAVGLKSTKLVFSNKANRKAILGADPEAVVAYEPGPDGKLGKKIETKGQTPRAVESLLIAQGEGGGTKKHAQAQLGEKAYEFLKRHLDRAGLFLWAAADGSYVLSEPNTAQNAVFELFRSQGAAPEFSVIEDSKLTHKTQGRYSKISVYTRGETKKAGRAKSVASVTDSEMVELGFVRPMVLRDPNADTVKKAEFMARRKLAESRRAGWKLSYTVSGHVSGSRLDRQLTWAPDTMVRVSDARYGIFENLWVESVTFSGSPHATTTIELMRPQDLVFGDAPT